MRDWLAPSARRTATSVSLDEARTSDTRILTLTSHGIAVRNLQPLKHHMTAVSCRACLSVLVAAGIALGSTPSAGEDRHRTPAEIELRRSEIAARLTVLAAEEARLTARIADADAAIAPELAAQVQRVVDERNVLLVEARELAALVTRSATGPLTRADPPGLTPAQIAGGTGQVSAGTAFNPAITVIPDGLYYYDNAGGGAAAAIGERFGPSGASVEAEDSPRGFSLREVELAFSGAVDPYFDVWATFGISEDAIETEEVYVQTRRFLPGTQVKFGQFLSGVGYLNRQHRHQWDFVDAPVPYAALFGSSLEEVGVQVTWLPATRVYTQFGFEALQGDNGLIANQLADEYSGVLEETPGPRLFTGFLKMSPDLGYSNTLQAGVSIARSRSHQEADAEGSVYDGTAWFLGTDWIWRYDSARPYGEGDLTVQGEYIYRSKTLDLVSVADLQDTTFQQDGLYAQVVYGVGPRWTLAGRIDAAGLRNRVDTPTTTMDLGATTRYSVNATFNPTEFSRLRVQYNHARVPDDSRTRFHQVYVQFQMSLGVHGAHVF